MAAAPGGDGRPVYSASAYWDTRYTGPAKNFDWFFNYPALKELFHKYLPSGRVLHVGCGNSKIQEGMAGDGFEVTNVDISPVVIEQMKCQHAEIQSLGYLVADCRDMSQLASGSFGSCIDTGRRPMQQSGQPDAIKYLHEIERLLQSGGTFLLISLGAPAARIALLQKQQWEAVQVLLLPKPLLYLLSDTTMTGRPLPPKCAADKDEPIQAVGPWSAAQVLEELAQSKLDARDYFFGYICSKSGAKEELAYQGIGNQQQLGEQGQEQQEPPPGTAGCIFHGPSRAQDSAGSGVMGELAHAVKPKAMSCCTYRP